MRLVDAVTKGKGKAGHWEVTSGWNQSHTHHIAMLWHYSTPMLKWDTDNPADETILAYGVGHGSKSDQDGMNKAFRALGLNLYFSRAGGAQINDNREVATCQ